MNFQETDSADGWLEICSIHNEGIIFCRSKKLQESLPDLQRIDRGWSGSLWRDQISFDGEALPGQETSIREGSSLLCEEERLLVLWQTDETIIVSTEDREWQEQISSFCASPFEKIVRPGGDTLLWRLPRECLRISRRSDSNR